VLTVLDSAHLRGRNMQVVEEVVAPALLERLMDSTPSVVEAAEAALVSLRSSHGEALTAALLDASVPVQRLYQQRLGADEDCQRSGAAPARRWDVPGGDDAGSSEFVSARLLAELQDPNNWRVRALAVEELQAMVRAVRGPEDLRTHLLQLVELLVGLVQDTNFKIQITALQTLGYMVSIMGPEVGPLLPRVLPELLDKLGDNKTLVRHASSRAVLRLMGAVGPQPVVAELVPVLGHDAWHTREEALSLCMLAMLRFRDASFDAETLARSVRGCLEDSKPKVKQTAVECLALLNARGGKVLLLLTDLDEATRRMLEARFAQPQLASMTAEGSLEMPALSQLLEEETAPRGMLGSVPAILEGWTNVGLGPVTQAPGGGASPDHRRQPRDEEQPGAASPIGGRGRTAGRRRPDLHVADDSDGPVRTGGVDGAVDGTADGVVRSGAGYSAAMSQASTQHHASPGRTPHEPPREAAGGALHAHVAVGNNGLGDEMLEDDQPLYRETPLDTPPSPLAVGAAASGFRGGSPLAGKTPRRMRGGAESASLGAGGVLVGTGGGMGEIAGGARGPIKPFWMDGLDQPPAPDTQGAYGGGGGRGLALDDGGETRGARAAPAGRRAGAMQGRAAAVQRGQGHTGGAYEDIFGSSGPFARTGSSEEETGGRPLWSAKELSSSQFQSLPGAQVEESPPRSPRGDANLPVLAYTISAPLPEADPSERPGSDQLSRSLRSREDNIASRLSILKSRSTGIRGRTGSGRRVVSASAAFGATDQSSAGLGATTPVDPLQREPDLEDGPSSPVQRGLSERFTMRPSLSAPTNPHTAHGTSRRERGGDSYHRRGAPAPTHMGAGSSDEEDSGQRREVRSAMDAGARPSGGYTEPVHTPTEELQPVENPDTTMRTLIERLGSSDWAVQMEALNDLRALSIYHAPQTVLPNLHQVVRHTLLVADNLRSQLSKAAIMSLADMLRYLKAHMDPELDKLVITLVKKAGETSGFIAEEAKKAMLAAIDNCSEHRTISALLHANVNKNSIIRGKVALFLQVAIENLGNRVVASRELERLFPVIVRYLSEGQMEPRAAGKKALLDIHRHTKASGEFERLLRRCPASDVKVVDKVIAQEAANNDAWTVRPGTLQTGRADLTTTLGSSSRSLSRHSGTLGQGKEATRTAEVIGDFGSSTSTRRAFEGGAEDLVVGSGQLGSRGARRIRTGGGDGKGMSAQSWQSLLDAPGFERLGDITHAAEKGDFRARADAVHDLTQLLIAQRQVHPASARSFLSSCSAPSSNADGALCAGVRPAARCIR
jgi:HEAT repeat protein